MKSLSDMINVNNTNSRFNYKEYIEPRFYESSIYFEGDESSTIYVNEHIIKYVLEERKREILNEIQKYNPNIQKLNIWDDKKGAVKARNLKIQKLNEIQNNLSYELKEKSPMKAEDISKIYENIEKMDIDKEDKEYLKSIAEIYISNYDDTLEKCSICGERFTYTFDGMCSICLKEDYDRKFNNAVIEINNNPLLINNSKIYTEARKYLIDRVIEEIFKQYDKSVNKKELRIPELFRRYAMLKTNSDELELQVLVSKKLKESIEKYYEEKRNVK
ncbi:hypothetical protein [Pseudostreptobacillus hongkongensis]|uniref:hypothetical protein n=1 Tax=Pseudostreptobacillus hongkongensis TaxID=1162717 RepID=UPI00083298CA|nr:hypothetical protein [Pseudostreptobacillus hongkongensis]